MRAIDTNVLVRLIVRDDRKQTAAAEAFVADRGAWVPVLALAEATWVLRSVYNLEADRIALAIEMLLDHRSLVIEDHEAVRRAWDLFRARPSLGFSDCLMLEVARRSSHLPLGTFDRNLAKTSGAVKL